MRVPAQPPAVSGTAPSNLLRVKAGRGTSAGCKAEAEGRTHEQLVLVCRTCVTEEVSDFRLCSTTFSSSSAVRARLLVGVAAKAIHSNRGEHANDQHRQ